MSGPSWKYRQKFRSRLFRCANDILGALTILEKTKNTPGFKNLADPSFFISEELSA